MSDQIHIDITGDRQVGLRFDAFPDELYDALRAEIDGLANELFALVRAKTPELTGRLLSQEGVKVFADKDKISGKVYIAAKDQADAVKAADLEYGSTGKSVGIKSHEMQLDHYWSHLLAAPETVIVKAYSRTPDIAEHAFERGPLEAMQPEVIARLNAVVDGATKAADA